MIERHDGVIAICADTQAELAEAEVALVREFSHVELIWTAASVRVYKTCSPGN